jgi:uncharacterized surface protein with fasciclin (FAS1) repeats
LLVQSKNYNTFLSLIQATGVEALLLKHDTPPGVTIFAPDDAAFAKLPKGKGERKNQGLFFAPPRALIWVRFWLQRNE